MGLQSNIVSALTKLEGQAFLTDCWERPSEPNATGLEGGGGISRVIEQGDFFERGGINFSHVAGTNLPPSASAHRPELAGNNWEATGISLVLHPRNPYCPTVHMNLRFFTVHRQSQPSVWWFGGGMDLTPYYGFTKDAQHFHQTCKNTLDPFGHALYPEFKTRCDQYFYLKHRQEPRGIGGIFFDDFNRFSFEDSFNMIQQIGNAFVPAYLPIIERTKKLNYTQRERDFQAYRRGRYVEFNLVFDRGTLFGLQSGGRTESILISLPPVVHWRYNWQPEAGSPEAQLYSDFLVHKDWLA